MWPDSLVQKKKTAYAYIQSWSDQNLYHSAVLMAALENNFKAVKYLIRVSVSVWLTLVFHMSSSTLAFAHIHIYINNIRYVYCTLLCTEQYIFYSDYKIYWSMLRLTCNGWDVLSFCQVLFFDHCIPDQTEAVSLSKLINQNVHVSIYQSQLYKVICSTLIINRFRVALKGPKSLAVMRSEPVTFWLLYIHG